jgi:hypothetical protein
MAICLPALVTPVESSLRRTLVRSYRYSAIESLFGVVLIF